MTKRVVLVGKITKRRWSDSQQYTYLWNYGTHYRLGVKVKLDNGDVSMSAVNLPKDID